jgi:TRAP-type mannitol/chloroaromatic compound transport system substrate-binding protein
MGASAEKPKHREGGERMKRRQFLKTAGLGVAASAVAAPAIAQSMPELKWRLTASWPKSLDTLFGGAVDFAEAVAAATDNKFQIQTFAAGEIVPALQALDAASNGTVEVAHTASYYYFGKDPTFGIGTSIAFGPNQRLNQGWYYEGGGKDALNEFYKKYNVTMFVGGNTGCQMGGWFRKEINSVGDLKGLKFRIGGFPGKVIAKLGGVPQLIGAPDIYPSLEKGVIDAAEWVGPYDDEKLGFYKVAKNYYTPGWWEGGSMINIFINMDKWNSLPKSYQAIVQNAAAWANDRMVAKYDKLNPPALKRLIANGVKLHAFSPAIMEACWKAANELHHEIAGTNASFKKVYESMMAFQSAAYPWFRVAELSYDSFMIRHLS